MLQVTVSCQNFEHADDAILQSGKWKSLRWNQCWNQNHWKNTSCWHSHLFCFGNGAISAVACCHNVQFVGQKPNLRHTRWLHFLTGTTAMPKHQQIILEWRTFSTLHRDLDHWRKKKKDRDHSSSEGGRPLPWTLRVYLADGSVCVRLCV